MNWLKRWIKHGPLFELLQRIRYRIRPFPRRSSHSYISHVNVFPIQENVVLETSYMGPEFGPGPVASIYIFDHEVMRLDCLGGDRGHFHVNMTQSLFRPNGENARFYFPEGTVEEHIECAAFQLRRNLDYARSQNYRRRVRSVELDRSRIEVVSRQMREELRRLHRQMEEG